VNPPNAPLPAELAAELISLPGEDLDARLRGMSELEATRAVEAIRGIASGFYHSDAATARRVAERALKVAERTGGHPAALGWGHRAMAEAFLFSGRMRQAEASYEQAARALRAARESGLLGQLLVGRLHVLSLLGRHADAEATAREARRCLEAAGDKAYLAKLAMNLGNLRIQLDRYAPALEAYERAGALFRRLRIRDETVIALDVNRGVAMTQLDRDVEAMDLFRRLERECEGRQSHLLLAQVRMNAAYVHSMRADFHDALRDLTKATDYFLTTNHPAFSATCHLNRAEIYHKLNLHREARELTERAAPLFAAEGLIYDQGLAIAQGALSSMALGETASAIRKLKRARAIFGREKSAAWVAVADLLLAEAYSRHPRGRSRDEVAARASSALAAFRSLRLIRWEAAAAILLGGPEDSEASARAEIRRLRPILRRMPRSLYPIAASRVLERIGGAQERAGRATDAARSYREAIRRIEDVRSRIPSEDSKISFLQDKTHLYDRLISLEIAAAHPSTERIFEVMERSRAQSLWDRLRSPESYLGEEDRTGRSLRRRISWLHGRVSRLELGTSEQRAQAARLRRDLEEAEEGWRRSLRGRTEAAGITPRKLEGRIPTCGEIAGALPKGWGFLTYHVSKEFAIALAITREGAMWRKLRADTARRLGALADRLEFQWSAASMASAVGPSTGESGTARDAAGGRGGEEGGSAALRPYADEILLELGNLLLKPVREMVPDPAIRWIVSPHGQIHRIPFHALREPGGYLIDRTDVLLAPSARIWQGLPRPRRAQERRALVVGLPSPELPGVACEVERVCERLIGWRVEQDLSPTREKLRTRARQAHLLHIASHGSLRSDNPAYSYIQVADGPLFVHDLAGFRLPGSTVVLTACSSGRGASPAGDEWIGLARGFLQAGASTVVASLWPVDDVSTLELMDLCYAEAASGAGMVLSLGSAMRALKARRPHPWQWASFAVLGRG
jgi:tetratricopeptide (TPR) repeat protein